MESSTSRLGPLQKLIRADATRRTRWHTSNGRLCLHLPDMALALASTLWRHVAGGRVAIPWIALPAFRFLRRRVRNAVVFEFSSGMSTLWYGRRCREVHAVEDDPAWYEVMAGRTAGMANVRLCLAEDREAYVSRVSRFPDAHFDLISIDGSHRPECYRRSLRHLKPGGMLLIDNTDAEATRPILAELPRDFDERRIRRFAGYAPGIFHPTETTICLAAPASDAATDTAPS